MFSQITSGPFCVAALVVALGASLATANAVDEIEVFRVYDWSSFETPDHDTTLDCMAIDKGKNERGWAVARREVADVSNLRLPNRQKEGTAFRVFVDYCVHLDGSRERPVGAMTFRSAPHDDLGNVKRWGSRHYKATTRTRKKTPKPGREHFDTPNFER